jgi:hypothetical protein
MAEPIKLYTPYGQFHLTQTKTILLTQSSTVISRSPSMRRSLDSSVIPERITGNSLNILDSLLMARNASLEVAIQSSRKQKNTT